MRFEGDLPDIMSTIGFIQTHGIGDVIIGLPIATWFVERGHRVVWPVSDRCCRAFQEAAPWVEFLPVPAGLETSDPTGYYYLTPRGMLEAAGCDVIHSLYSKLTLPGVDAVDARLAQSLKFDEYKYALTGVPFAEKWNLRIVRNDAREQALHASLDIRGPYIVTQSSGRETRSRFALPQEWTDQCRVIEIDERTDSPFDWIHTLEHARRLVLVDSCFANLVEQLNLPVEKHFVFRSTVPFTPVLRNAWHF
jgi:hypothetical protein